MEESKYSKEDFFSVDYHHKVYHKLANFTLLIHIYIYVSDDFLLVFQLFLLHPLVVSCCVRADDLPAAHMQVILFLALAMNHDSVV